MPRRQSSEHPVLFGPAGGPAPPLPSPPGAVRIPVRNTGRFVFEGRGPVVRGSEERRRFSKECPALPGVYGMYDRGGRLIYVGKSLRLRERLGSYLRSADLGEKAARIRVETHAVTWEVLPDEFGSLVREAELIGHFRPRYNVLDNPDRGSCAYLSLAPADAPGLAVTRSPPRNGERFGPVPRVSWLAESVREFNDYFGLRDCPRGTVMRFAEQATLWPESHRAGCHRGPLGLCSAPCSAGCSRSEYALRVRRARAFLTGADDEPLRELESSALSASDECRYERAAEHYGRRERLARLVTLVRDARSSAERLSLVYPVQAVGAGAGVTWYVIAGGRVRGAFPVGDDGPDPLLERLLRSLEERRGRQAGVGEEAAAVVRGWFRARASTGDGFGFSEALSVLEGRRRPRTGNG